MATETHTIYLNTDEFDVALDVEFEVSGQYAPATWGYDGGEPEEFPEVEVTAVYFEGDEVPFAWLFGDKAWSPAWKVNLKDVEDECFEHIMSR